MDSHSDRRIGVCLDIDGTLYRSGSVFVETLIRLPDAPGCSFTATERAQLRQALGIVGRYQGGPLTAWRWRSSLRLVDALRARGMDTLAPEVLGRLLAAQSLVDSVIPTRGDEQSPVGSYEELRTSLLQQYGTVIVGHDSETIRQGIETLFERVEPITPGVPAVCAEACQAGIDVTLVTDMPHHVAKPYAETLLAGSVQAIVGTDFETDAGRFTGAFDAVDKRDAVRQLRDRHDWEFIIAVGDTNRDLAMATPADHFIAVAGQGHIRDYLENPVVLNPDSQSRMDPTDVLVSFVPAEESVSDALRLVLGSV